MRKKPFHLRFFIGAVFEYFPKRRINWQMPTQIEYKGNSIAECVVKAQAYARRSPITSFTIRRGEGLGKNIKMGDYLKSL